MRRGNRIDVPSKISDCTKDSQSSQTFACTCTSSLVVRMKTLRNFWHCHRDAKGNRLDANAGSGSTGATVLYQLARYGWIDANGYWHTFPLLHGSHSIRPTGIESTLQCQRNLGSWEWHTDENFRPVVGQSLKAAGLKVVFRLAGDLANFPADRNNCECTCNVERSFVRLWLVRWSSYFQSPHAARLHHTNRVSVCVGVRAFVPAYSWCAGAI